MKKQDHTTHLFILAVHIIVALAILITYIDIKRDIYELRQVDLPQLKTDILIEH